MKATFRLFAMLTAWFGILSGSPIFSQKIFTIPPAPAPAKDTMRLEVRGYDKSNLIKFATADPAASPQPYFRYLYIFGDGNFINGVRDSIVRHSFIKQRGAPDGTGKNFAYDVVVYASDTYGGGQPPPDKSLLDTVIIDKGKGEKDTIIIGDAPKTGKATVKLDTALFRLSSTAKVKPVVKPNRYLALQKNHEFRPKDTSVVILSLKNPLISATGGLPGIAGQVYLFYNGKITGVTSTMKAGSGVKFANFHHDTTLIYPPFTWKVVLDTVAPGVSEYKRMLVLSYVNLLPQEERHFFFEFANNADLLDYIDIAGEDTAKVNFLAVITAVDTDIQGAYNPVLTIDQTKKLNLLGITTSLKGLETTLLPAIYDSIVATQALSQNFLPFGGDAQNYPSILLDMAEVTGKIVAAKDPNHLDAYACKCGGSSNRKILYKVTFTNDGLAPTSHVFVNIKIPAELDINSIADTVFFPAASGSGQVLLEKVGTDEIRFWMKNYRIFSTAEFGFGDSLTQGKITFSILANSGVSLEDVPPLQACIRFDSEAAPALCTNLAPVFFLEKPSPYAEVQSVLQCQDCPWYCEVCEKIGIESTLLCILVLVFAGILILLLLWLIRRLF